jgi:DNA repair protein RadC
MSIKARCRLHGEVFLSESIFLYNIISDITIIIIVNETNGDMARMIVSEKRAQIKSPETVYKLLASLLKKENQIDRDKEHFWVIGLTTRNTTLYVDLVSLGTLNASIVHPRELFRLAISRAVNAVILGHN